jgi:tetratricopeptide (TPR) repeat protein
VSTSTVDGPDPLIGRLVAQKYRLQKELGKGGIGRVYLAEQTNLGRRVALKVLHTDLAGDTQVARRFYREAKSASMLSHPNLLQIIDFGNDEGLLFIVMELIAGRDLRHVLREDWPLSSSRVVHIGVQILSALENTHRAGIVHRDLKPENVMLLDIPGEHDFVKVCDFGLAKIVTERENDGSMLSAAGGFCGTPEYMSPEQARGETLDGRSDLYSTAVMLYDLVVGDVPFKAETSVGVLMRHMHDAPDPPSKRLEGTLPALDAVIMKGLAKSPADRFASAGEMRRALLHAVGMETPRDQLMAAADSGGIRRVSPVATEQRTTAVGFAGRRVRRTLRSWWRRRWLVGGAAALLAFVAAFGGWWHWHRRGSGRASATAAARRSVMVLGFQNLSKRPDSAWLSTALAEMLDSELGQGGRLRSIGGEEAARVKGELGLGHLDVFGREALERIRRDVDADLVLVGSYVTLDEDLRRQLRIDLRVFDTASGEAVAQVADAGREAELFDLVVRIGRTLRTQLGVADAHAKDEGQVRATLPANVEAARAYAEGLNSLRLQDATTARERLGQAIALESTHALSHVAQARAWSALGYDEHAQEEARRAVDLATGMPREQRLFVAAYNYKVMHDWPKAIEAYKTLLDFFPDNVEYGIGLAEVQWLGQRASDALETINRLRALPAPQRDDPRIDLARVEALAAMTRNQQVAEAAEQTIQKATARGADSIVASAARLQSVAYERMGQCDKAVEAARRAKVTFERLEDRRGMAQANEALIHCQRERGDSADALRLANETLRISEELGDRRGTAAALNSVAGTLSSMGHSTEAIARWERAADIAREINDVGRLNIVLGNLAGARADRGDLEGARHAFEEAIGQRRQLDERSHLSHLLIVYADLLSDMGEPVAALKAVEESMAIAREINERDKIAHLMSMRASLRLMSGDFEGARNSIAESVRMHESAGQPLGVTACKQELADIEIEAGRLDVAESLLREILAGAGEAHRPSLLSNLHEQFARLFLAKGQPTDARAEIAASTAAAPPLVSFGTRQAMTLTRARIEGALGESAAARRRLGTVIAECRRAHFVDLELEARLALLQLANRGATAQAEARALSSEANRRGMLLLANKAATLAGTH